jgi:glycosyltransferase involved in cell wall biosynthesis
VRKKRKDNGMVLDSSYCSCKLYFNLYDIFIREENMRIEVGIPTKDRYENLAMILWSLAEQTYKNFVVTIIDDSEDRKDIRNLPYILPILERLDNEGHSWQVLFGEKRGPHWSFQRSLDASRCPYVFMIDDDCVLDKECLGHLVGAWREAEKIESGPVGVVGPIVMRPGAQREFNSLPEGYKWFKKYNGFIDEYGTCNGEHHWRYHPNDELQECSHLQCQLVSMEAVKKIGGFDLNYNASGFRTETDFCYRIFKAGYKLYVQPKALVWHFQSSSGGIRKLNVTKELYDQAEEYYLSKFRFKRGKNKDRVIRLSGGLGDHLSATPLLRALKKKGKVIVSAIYPFLFVGNANVDELIFISDEKDYKNVDQRDMYSWASRTGFTGKLSEAWCRTYGEEYDGDKLDYTIFPSEREWVISNVTGQTYNPFIVIGPYGAIPQVQFAEIGKTTDGGKVTVIRDWFKDRWEKLVKEIQKRGLHVIQVGGSGEGRIEGCNGYHIGIDYRLTMAILERSAGFVCVDSFLQHAGHALGIKGVILYGPSDPVIGGHDTNINLKVDKCDRDLICMKQSFPISHWTFKSKDCDSKICMKSITVKMVLDSLKEIIGN